MLKMMGRGWSADEELVTDGRAGLTPSDFVELKLLVLLRDYEKGDPTMALSTQHQAQMDQCQALAEERGVNWISLVTIFLSFLQQFLASLPANPPAPNPTPKP
jgi:hypothetical protein